MPQRKYSSATKFRDAAGIHAIVVLSSSLTLLLQDVSRLVAWRGLYVLWKRSRSLCTTMANREGGWELRIGGHGVETQGHPHCVEVHGPPWQKAAGSSPKLEVQAAAGAGTREQGERTISQKTITEWFAFAESIDCEISSLRLLWVRLMSRNQVDWAPLSPGEQKPDQRSLFLWVSL